MGRGSTSSVYAAIEAALAYDVKVINLSVSAPAVEGNAAVEQAIRDAYDAGVIVVGTAGNAGKDAKWYVPGHMDDETFIASSCDADGTRVSIANFGETVDLYDFIGWNTEADGTGTPYWVGQEVVNLADEGTTTVNLYAQWSAKQMRVTVPVAIHYAAWYDGSVTGPTDDVVKMSNEGETHVMLDRMAVVTDSTLALVSEANTPGDHEVSLGLRLDDDDRIDLSAVDGEAQQRYAWLAPDQDVFLNELNGRIGNHDLSDDTSIGHIEWHFKAMRASEQ